MPPRSPAHSSSDPPIRPNWALPAFHISTLKQMHAALSDPNLLSTYFERLDQITTTIESVAATAASCDTELTRDMISRKRVNVLFYGRSGAGKSTLVGTLAQARDELHKHGDAATTLDVTNYATASGIHFTDRPGIDIPGAQAQSAEGAATLAHMSTSSSLLKRGSDFLAELARRREWASQLGDLDRRLRSSSAEDRPLALVYVQHAAHRLYPERVRELISRSHAMLVPTFVLISDKWAVDKAALATKEAEVRAMVAAIGPNRRGALVETSTISSAPKEVGGTRHPETGVPEFVSLLLSTLDPADALTFIRHDSLLTKMFAGGAGSKRKRGAGSDGEE